MTRRPLVQLARIRRNVGLSQVELGLRSGGLSGQYIAMLEAGLCPSSETQAQVIADALGVALPLLRAAAVRIECSSLSGVVRFAAVESEP